MKILAAEFVTSAAAGPPAGSGPSRATSRDGIPRDGLAQVAFAGRSNVGKSTLLNALVRKKIARTSAAPGKTRLANIYRLSMEGGVGGPGKWAAYLVDLPGYGYARGGADSAEELAAVAETYFGRLRHESDKGSVRGPVPRPEPDRGTGPFDRVATLLLVDSRHPGLDSDIQAHKWLSTVGPPPRIVATKVDKLSRAERVRNLRELERVFGTAALPVSATGGEGLDELWRLIASLARDVERPRK